MPRFAANISTMYTEHVFVDRVEAAARDGFLAVECQFPYEVLAVELAAMLRANGLQQVLLNTPAGNAKAGERGLAGLPGREADFDAALDRAIEYACALECPKVHLMAGVVVEPAQRPAHLRAYLKNLRRAARRLAAHGLIGLIEPINPRDVPGYLISTQAEAHAILAEVAESNLKVQMDFYHCQIVEGDLAMRLRKHLDGVGHIQIAGVPDRHEPDDGEVAYAYLYRLIDTLGYDGWVGCEYFPRGATREGLGWLAQAK